ncbi:MAG: AAA family ATPase [Paenibacillus sp. RIFOXYA1_FULL_44_5]|nr:MAG: AAA family ATPase [Paenibacillus sp. RIFOXYA1_FULL_44_5]
MESLSDLLKDMKNREFWRALEEKTDEVLHDPLIVKWRSKYPDLDEKTLRSHMNRLYQYAKEYKQCSNCPGLERCPNDFAGHYTKLYVETINGQAHIYDHKVTCKKMTAKQKQDTLQRRIRSFYVDEKALFGGISVSEIVHNDPERVLAVDQIMEYILLTKEQGLQKEGLYLAGKFGTGKTFLMSFLLHELAKEGYSGAIVFMPDFVEDLKSMFAEPQRLKDMLDTLKESDLLIFDDIGAENLNPWVRDHVLGSILNYRMNRKPTFFTSNYELDQLEQHFSFTSKDGEEEYKGKRLMDRIRHYVKVIVVKGRNKREA